MGIEQGLLLIVAGFRTEETQLAVISPGVLPTLPSADPYLQVEFFQARSPIVS